MEITAVLHFMKKCGNTHFAYTWSETARSMSIIKKTFYVILVSRRREIEKKTMQYESNYKGCRIFSVAPAKLSEKKQRSMRTLDLLLPVHAATS